MWPTINVQHKPNLNLTMLLISPATAAVLSDSAFQLFETEHLSEPLGYFSSLPLPLPSARSWVCWYCTAEEFRRAFPFARCHRRNLLSHRRIEHTSGTADALCYPQLLIKHSSLPVIVVKTALSTLQLRLFRPVSI